MRLFIPVSVFRFHAIVLHDDALLFELVFIYKFMFPCFSYILCVEDGEEKERGARLIYLNYN